jgi:hypothetical protein
MENKDSLLPKKVRISKRILKVFQARYEGKKYEDISKETGYSLNTLYKYFQKNGRWYIPYIEFEKDLNDEVIRVAKEMHRKGAIDATKINLAALSFIKSDPRIALDAAHDILDRAGLKPAQDITLKDESENVAEEMLTEIEKHEAKKKDGK